MLERKISILAITFLAIFVLAGCSNNSEKNNEIETDGSQDYSSSAPNEDLQIINDLEDSENEKNATVQSNEDQEEQSEGNVSDWLTYTNAKAKYKISYPKTYAVTEYQDNQGSVSLNFKDVNNINYHGGGISVRTGSSANTADNLLAGIKEACDEYDLCAEISEDKIVDLSDFKARKIKYSRAIGGYSTSYFFVREDGEKLNFELSLNWEDEVREKIVNSFEFF